MRASASGTVADGDEARRVHPGDVEQLEAVGVGHPQIAELQRRGAGVAQRDGGGVARVERVVEVDDDEPGRGGDVGVMAAERDVARAVEHSALVPGDGALEEIVARLAVGEGLDVDQDQPFLGSR